MVILSGATRSEGSPAPPSDNLRSRSVQEIVILRPTPLVCVGRRISPNHQATARGRGLCLRSGRLSGGPIRAAASIENQTRPRAAKAAAQRYALGAASFGGVETPPFHPQSRVAPGWPAFDAPTQNSARQASRQKSGSKLPHSTGGSAIWSAGALAPLFAAWACPARPPELPSIGGACSVREPFSSAHAQATGTRICTRTVLAAT